MSFQPIKSISGLESMLGLHASCSAYIAAPDKLTALVGECAAGEGGEFVEGSLVISSTNFRPAFAVQSLPNPVFLRAESISGWSRLLLEHIVRFEEGAGSVASEPNDCFLFHIFGVGGALDRRSTLIQNDLLELFRKKRRSLLRKRSELPVSPFENRLVVAQLYLLSPETGIFSIARSVDGYPSPFVGGVPQIDRDPLPPSRAYMKLLETEAHLWRPIRKAESCVDLGAAPGSWSWIALGRGATVRAIDRSPLVAELMSNRNLQFHKGDALTYLPEEPFDWLLCDVICEPSRTVALLSSWVGRNLCRNLVVTLKFKGIPDYQAIADASEIIADVGDRRLVRHLSCNKNEVTVAAVSA